MPTRRQTSHRTARLGGLVAAQHVKTQCAREQSLSPEENWAPITRDPSYKLGSIQTEIRRIKKLPYTNFNL